MRQALHLVSKPWRLGAGVSLLALMLMLLLMLMLATLAPAQAAVRVEVNDANQAELEMITGIGPALSAQILSERRAAPFRDWADFVQRIKGVGPRRAAKLSDAGLTINQTGWSQPPRLLPRSAPGP